MCRHPLPRLAPFCAMMIALACAAPGVAAELDHARFANVPVLPAGAPGSPIAALLTVPAGWAPGGPAVVLAWAPRTPSGGCAARVFELLEAGFGVLELPLPDAPVAALAPWVEGAVAELRDEAGAGRILLGGTGAGLAAAQLVADRLGLPLSLPGPAAATPPASVSAALLPQRR